jgi:hypothetical protein
MGREVALGAEDMYGRAKAGAEYAWEKAVNAAHAAEDEAARLVDEAHRLDDEATKKGAKVGDKLRQKAFELRDEADRLDDEATKKGAEVRQKASELYKTARHDIKLFFNDAEGDYLACPFANLKPPDCDKLADASDKAMLANHVYWAGKRDGKPPELPKGYSFLDPETLQGRAALEKLGVKPEDLEPSQSNFRAAIYQKTDPHGNPVYVVSFRGTQPESGQDWWNNAEQSVGLPSDYYDKAKVLARTVDLTSRGSVEFTGHSLGGGLASAAAAATGKPAITYNAAGLHANNAGGYRENPAPVDAYYVPGDFLSGVQDNIGGPQPYGNRHRLPSDPPPWKSFWDCLNPVDKHGMDWVEYGIKVWRKELGCPET